jgi:hypothetical protein
VARQNDKNNRQKPGPKQSAKQSQSSGGGVDFGKPGQRRPEGWGDAPGQLRYQGQDGAGARNANTRTVGGQVAPAQGATGVDEDE